MIANPAVLLMKKSLIKLFTFLFGIYLSLLMFAVFASDQLIFLPQRASYPMTADLVAVLAADADNPVSQHRIIARYLKHPDATRTVIYSHGNAVDIGRLTRLQQHFYDHGYSSIFYDYSGYGLSEGLASEQQVYNDVLAVYDHFITDIASDDIIAYGHSLGSAIATFLATRRQVSALVLESPFVSAFRVKTVIKLLPFEKFDTLSRISQVDVPVLIMHDRDDTVIPFWHGKTLFDATLAPKSSLWTRGLGHSGISHSAVFWPTLDRFLEDTDTIR